MSREKELFDHIATIKPRYEEWANGPFAGAVAMIWRILANFARDLDLPTNGSNGLDYIDKLIEVLEYETMDEELAKDVIQERASPIRTIPVETYEDVDNRARKAEETTGKLIAEAYGYKHLSEVPEEKTLEGLINTLTTRESLGMEEMKWSKHYAIKDIVNLYHAYSQEYMKRTK